MFNTPIMRFLTDLFQADDVRFVSETPDLASVLM